MNLSLYLYKARSIVVVVKLKYEIQNNSFPCQFITMKSYILKSSQ